MKKSIAEQSREELSKLLCDTCWTVFETLADKDALMCDACQVRVARMMVQKRKRIDEMLAEVNSRFGL